MIVIEPGFTGIAHGLHTPRFGASPHAGTITASSAAAGFDAAFAANNLTGQYWKPAALPATWEIDFGGPLPVSYFGVAAQNLGTAGAALDFQTWDGLSWTTHITHSPTDDSPIFGLTRRRSPTKARFSISGATIPVVGVFFVGDVTEFPEPAPYVGRVDWNDMIDEVYSTTLSDGGHWLDRTVVRRTQPLQMQVDHLSEAFKADVLDPLTAYLRGAPAFVAERPGEFPAAAGYAYTTAVVRPERARPGRLASVSVQFEMVGHVA